MIGSGEQPMFALGWPHDPLTLGCLVLAGLCLLLRLPRRFSQSQLWGLLLALSLFGGALSVAYFHHYLEGQPRLIDATTYLFQARTLAEGSFGLKTEGPSASFRGRFLLSTEQDPHVITGIFPPGYPALLSIGVRLGHFEWVGPLIAALLVLATFRLGYLLFGHKKTALVAATFCAVNACLRYHTAETMSHGWSTLLALLALCEAVSLSRSTTTDQKRRRALLRLGLSLGLLISTRQLTGLLLTIACTIPLVWRAWLGGPRTPVSSKHLILPPLLLLLGMVPGLLLLLSHHNFVTDSFWESPQSYYYRRADGPPGCFSLGWGSGCHYEHGDVVSQQGGTGLSTKWMALNTLHRLHWHLMDIAHFEPLALLGGYWAWRQRRKVRALPVLLVLVTLPLGYGLFYFNGSYPGGGARFFSELIPLWHCFLAAALVRFRVVSWGFSACLAGFALHANYAHEQLASMHFGPSSRPLLEAFDQIEAPPGRPPSILFVSSAHHFNLATARSTHVTAARRTHDLREALVVASHPGAQAYTFDESDGLKEWAPPSSQTFRVESEFDYPALDVQHAWVHPEHLPFSCVSRGRALRIHQLDPKEARLTVELPSPLRGRTVVAWIVNEKATSHPCRAVALGQAPDSPTWSVPLRSFGTFTHLDRLEMSIP